MAESLPRRPKKHVGFASQTTNLETGSHTQVAPTSSTKPPGSETIQEYERPPGQDRNGGAERGRDRLRSPSVKDEESVASPAHRSGSRTRKEPPRPRTISSSQASTKSTPNVVSPLPETRTGPAAHAGSPAHHRGQRRSASTHSARNATQSPTLPETPTGYHMPHRTRSRSRSIHQEARAHHQVPELSRSPGIPHRHRRSRKRKIKKLSILDCCSMC